MQSPRSTASRALREFRQWGRVGLGLAVLAWLALLGGAALLLTNIGAPGDGAHGIAAVRGGLTFALALMVVASVASTTCSVIAWRRRRGRTSAAVAALLLALLVMVVGVPLLA